MKTEESESRDFRSSATPSPQVLHAALDRSFVASMVPIMLALAIIFAISTVMHLVVLAGAVQITLTAMTSVLMIACLFVAHLTYRQSVSDRTAHLLGVCVAGGALVYTLAQLVLQRQPQHSFFVSIFIIGFGVFLLSRVYMAVLMLAAIIGWAVIAMTGNPRAVWLDYFYFHMLATGISVAYFVVRRRNVLDIETLTYERQFQDQAIRESEARFRKLVQNSTDIITLLNADGDVTYESDSASRIFGPAAATLLNKPLMGAVHDEDKTQFVAALKTLATTPQHPQHFSFRRATAPDQWRFMEAVAVNLLADPQVGSIVINSRDVTERKKVSVALATNQRFISLAQEIAHVGKWEWNLETNKIAWSTELMAIHGITSNDFDGSLEFATSLIHPDDRHLVQRSIESIVETRQSHPIEYRIIRPDGEERTLWGDGEFLLDENKTFSRIIGVVQDITELKIAEQERQRLEGELKQTQKLEAVGTLAGGIAHDFNNYLTAINGYIDLSLMSLPDDHKATETLKLVREAANKAAGVVGALQTFSRHNSSDKVPINLTATLRQTKNILRKLLPASIEFVDELSTKELWIRANANQLAHVWLNLVLNARDAMPKGGKLAIQLEYIPPASHANNFNNENARDSDSDSDDKNDSDSENATDQLSQSDHGRAQFSFTDTGCGMSAKLIDRVFEPFFTTKPHTERSGLGLAITHSIVTDHDGHIGIHSVIGKGTRFTVTIPCCLPSQDARPSDSNASSTPGHGETILLAADNDLVRAVMTTHLNQAGYNLKAVADGDQAVEYFQQHHDTINLAILDLDLPKRSGDDCIEIMREQSPDLPIIIATGDVQGKTSNVEADNIIVLNKPFQLEILVRTIARVLQSNTPNASE